jgi:predicted alpha/beta superfamily hydrolase
MDFISRRSFLAAATALGLQSSSVAQSQIKRESLRDPLAGNAMTSPLGDLPIGTIMRSEEFDLKANYGTTYKIQVGFPHVVSSDLELEIKGVKPSALYIVDGESFFGLATDLTRFMQWGGDTPPIFVVAIRYAAETPEFMENARREDLTPTRTTFRVSSGQQQKSTSRSNSLPGSIKPSPKPYGGNGPLFLDFIVKTVKPMIEKRYNLDPQDSVLAGHSLGGLFAIDAITRQSGAFRHYLAMSPSLWWDDQYPAKTLSAALAKGFQSSGRLAVFVGDREEQISGPIARMTSNVIALRSLLKRYPKAFNSVWIEVLPDEDHHTVQGISLSRGLRFLLTDKVATQPLG